MVKRNAYFPYREFIPKTKRKEKAQRLEELVNIARFAY